jgi:ATP-dependent exoDNAse (exonuclease V) beta subunit
MFTLYNASAGSGKTTHLVIEYLTLCFRDIEKYRNILAITFTNNATAEMKQRIVETLTVFAFQKYEQFNGSQKAIFDKIKNNLQLNNAEIEKKANLLLENILYDYANFSISTIDSFFQRIIRSFALDLGLNLNFNIKIQLDEFYTQAIDTLLNRISSENKELSDRVLEVVKIKMEETGNWNVEKELLNFLPIIYNERAYQPLKAFEDVSASELHEESKKLFATINEIKNNILHLAEEGNRCIKNLSDQSNDFHYGKNGIFGWFEKIIASDGKNVKVGANITKAIEEKGAFTKNGMDVQSGDFEKLSSLVYTIIEESNKLNSQLSISKNLKLLLLLVDLKKIMDEIKMRDNLFYLSETNAKIFDNIKDEETPYIFEKLGNRYGYFFIDEFQDTSKMQWENLLPLLKNALSQHYYPFPDETGKVILFGDMKQAIYRFRNGDASLFKELSTADGYKKIINPNDKNCEQYDLQTLDTNYRSYKYVVDFNNRFFLFLKSLQEDEKVKFPLAEEYYRAVEQKIGNESGTGFVSIQFKTEEEEYLNKKVREAVDDAISKGFSYKEIAILTRGNDLGSQLGQLLTKKSIPVISADSLLLASSDKVNVVISTLQILANRENKIAILFIIQHLLRQDISNIPPAAWEDSYNFLLETFKKQGINFNPKSLIKLPLYSLVSEICRIFNFSQSDAYIAEFLETIFQFENNKGKELFQLLLWWEEEKGNLSLSSAEGMNAVTVSSIHKAKGLEYPIVILPIQSYKAQATQSSFWYKNEDEESVFPYYLINCTKQLEDTKFEEKYNEEMEISAIDQLNILYVGHTRAKKGLYIITGDKEESRGNYAKFLHLFINHETENSNFIFDEEKNKYWFGNKDFKNEKIAEDYKTDDPTLFSLSFTQFNFNQLITTSAVTLSEEQEMGIYVHNYLSQLQTFPQTAEEIEKIDFSAEDKIYIPAIKKALLKIVNDKNLAPYFSNDKSIRAYNEMTITNAHGELKRPDRIVFLENEVKVFDYKTGKELPVYQQQLDSYCQLLREMGYENVSGQIIYL